MTIYHGIRTKDGVLVTGNGRILTPAKSQKVWNHSPDGFDWGYNGSGPAQLALAILLEELPVALAQVLYQDFKAGVIARLPREWWVLTSHEIGAWLSTCKAEVHLRLVIAVEEDCTSADAIADEEKGSRPS